MDPEVSVPKDAKASPIELPTAEPELDPEGSCILQYAPVVCPPRDVHPLVLLLI